MVVLTALQVEYEAVRRHLTDVEEVELPQGTLLDVGRVPGLDWRLALAETGPTNTRAALVTQSAIEHFDADAVFFVGVAGSLKDDVRLGDVVVASKIYGYHGGRESADGFSARPVLGETSYRMDQLVRSACRNNPWVCLTPAAEPSARPAVHFAPIAAGDVLIGSRASETARRIRRHYNDAVAVDMESHGVAQAARMHGTVEMLAIRGISDFAGPEKATADARGSQRTASRHAAAFALRILRDLRPAGRAPLERPGRPATVVVSGPGRNAGTTDWETRPVVRAGGQEYLLYKGPGDLLQESRDGDVVRRQAVARVTSDRDSRGSYVWLRQIEWERPLPGAGFDPLAALEQETRLCLEHRGPGVVQLSRGGNTATLALTWPADRRLGRPLGTLYELLPLATARPDPLRLLTIVKGLATVAEFLGRLHDGELSHRALRPTAIVMGRQHASLRDFGLATVPPRRGEHAGPYQAPEQRHGSVTRPGPAADVYQVGALLQHALTGRPPTPGLPAFRPSGAVPDTLAQAVADALRQDPAARPGIRTLRLQLLAATRDLLAVPPQR
ncbi:phosphorylase family protein [Streptomyces lydicus]